MVEVALYNAEGGFFATGGGAGRSGRDFLTSPEVGPLFGILIARAIDRWWDDLGRPDPFVVIEAGAGRGTLARSVLLASPRCAKALRYVLVERSAVLRDEQRSILPVEPLEDVLGPVRTGASDEADENPQRVTGIGPLLTSIEALPTVDCVGVVFANELLDNLPFDVVEHTSSGWAEVRVGISGVTPAEFCEILVPASDDLVAEVEQFAPGAPIGSRVPVQRGIGPWLSEASASLSDGFVAVIDYAAPAEELIARGAEGWLRTYRGHLRAASPLVSIGEQDITADVVLESLRRAAREAGLVSVWDGSQASWIEELGLEELLAEGRKVWQERAAIGDLEALAARSRIGEAGALRAEPGLGAHHVEVFAVGRTARASQKSGR